MIEEKDEIISVTRKESNSGNVDYSEPKILYETSKSRVIFIPFYIKRTEGNVLAFKIQTFSKGKPPFDWILNEGKSISFSEDTARKLLKELKAHFAIAEKGEKGDYIAIKVTDGIANISDHDPGMIAQAVMGILNQREIVDHINFQNLNNELLTAFKGAIRLKELQTAISILKNNLDSKIYEESVYQEWCEKHSWAFGNAYVMKDDIRTITSSDKLDLLLPNVMTGFRDIIELKRPNMEVLIYDSSHKNYYFGSDVSKSIGQCHRYLDMFQDVAAKGLLDNPDIVAYHPRATIVIGRSADWDKDKLRNLHGLNQRLNNITIMTYDQLVALGQRLISIVSENSMKDKEDIDELMEMQKNEDSNIEDIF